MHKHLSLSPCTPYPTTTIAYASCRAWCLRGGLGDWNKNKQAMQKHPPLGQAARLSQRAREKSSASENSVNHRKSAKRVP